MDNAEKSSPWGNIYQKLSHVQLSLKVPKSQYNKFGDYYYRNCEDIQEAAKPIMGQIGTVLVISDDLVQIGDRFYIKATARFIDTDSGESVENTAYAREAIDKKGMDVSQVTGSTSSYARKYALNGLFCIDDTKDADTLQAPDGPDPMQPDGKQPKQADQAAPAQNKAHQATGKTDGKPAPKAQLISSQQINTLFMEMSRTGIKEKVLLDAAHVDDFHKLTQALYDGLMKRLKATPDKPREDYSEMVPPEDVDDGGLPWNTPAG